MAYTTIGSRLVVGKRLYEQSTDTPIDRAETHEMDQKLNLDGRRFRVVDNDSGLSSAKTIFQYNQRESLLTGEYSGGGVEIGSVVGHIVSPTIIELLFQCRTLDGELRSGESVGALRRDGRGKLSISFDWQWLSGGLGSGVSRHDEL